MLIAFTHGTYVSLNDHDLAILSSLGFRVPGADVSVREPSYPLILAGPVPARTSGYMESLGYEMWRHSTHRSGELKLVFSAGGNPGRWPQASVPSTWWDWKTALSFRQDGFHINVLEMRANLAALKWRVRTRGHIGKIYIHLLDSMVCHSALSKGRSSSRQLNTIIRRFNMLQVASNTVQISAHVRSALNPADRPSRWIKNPRTRRSENLIK